MSCQFGNPKGRFSHVGAHTIAFFLSKHLLQFVYRYQDTDEAVQTLPDWPTSLSNTRAEFESSETFLKTLNRHRFVYVITDL